MEWIALAVLLLVVVPLGLGFLGIAVTLWLVWVVAATLWGLLTWILGDPLVAVVVALGIGILIGRGGRARPLPGGPWPPR
jgi:hypothetical protein